MSHVVLNDTIRARLDFVNPATINGNLAER